MNLYAARPDYAPELETVTFMAADDDEARDTAAVILAQDRDKGYDSPSVRLYRVPGPPLESLGVVDTTEGGAWIETLRGNPARTEAWASVNPDARGLPEGITTCERCPAVIDLQRSEYLMVHTGDQVAPGQTNVVARVHAGCAQWLGWSTGRYTPGNGYRATPASVNPDAPVELSAAEFTEDAAATCDGCGQSALKAYPPDQAPTAADQYTCVHCVPQDEDEDEDRDWVAEGRAIADAWVSAGTSESEIAGIVSVMLGKRRDHWVESGDSLSVAVHAAAGDPACDCGPFPCWAIESGSHKAGAFYARLQELGAIPTS